MAADLSLATERWPTFAPRAVAAGIGSVRAFPMRLRDRTAGALNVFGPQYPALGSGDMKVIQALADLATIAIIQERQITVAKTVTQQLQDAHNSRLIIDQATGVMAGSTTMTVDDAFHAMRSYARGHSLKLTDLAHAVVDGGLDTTILQPTGGVTT